MRQKLYNNLVNRHIGITTRYHKMHDGAVGIKKVLSWLYLLWLNFAYYVLFCHFLGRSPKMDIYEEKKLNEMESESRSYQTKKKKMSVQQYVSALAKYDIVSFDIFDTLILRPLGQPTDVFYLIGEKLGISNFKNIRAWAEWDARIKSDQKNGHMEITLKDIWKNLYEDVGEQARDGMQVEIDTELSLCYANPFMLEVWQELRRWGKDIIVVSDMYLPSDVLETMLKQNGFIGFKELYVSCEYGKNKASGTLFEKVKKDYPDKSIVHVGDNPRSDYVMAKKAGFATMPYPNVNHNMLLYRPYDMSYLVGSAYRGIVSNHLYNGLHTYSMEYEYGYIYGGLFVLGYCRFIHEYCKNNAIDTLLFLSRDGDILKQAYDFLYPNENTHYVYWSRKAATILMAGEDKHDFFRRFIYHKVNQEYTIREILKSMELEFLADELDDWVGIWTSWKCKMHSDEKFVALHAEDELTDKNGYLLRRFIEAKWDKVMATYEGHQRGAKKYYRHVLMGAKRAVAVDIGWAGSGAMALSHLVEHVWQIPCSITGIIAGTNTVHNTEPDASEPFLQSKKLVAYLYSQRHNRDLLKKHDPNKDYNVFWELLLSSPTPQFVGFYAGDKRKNKEDDRYIEDLDLTLCFGKYDKNQEGIREIQKGIWDFVADYYEHFKAYPYLFAISGRDAYAPMLVAASHDEKYLKAIEKKFQLEINVN